MIKITYMQGMKFTPFQERFLYDHLSCTYDLACND